MARHKCCLCGREFYGYGNNPWPAAKDGRCCDDCNADVVLPARVEMIRAGGSVNPDLPQCVTGASKTGVCGNRRCIDQQPGIRCCAACKERAECNSACGWITSE